MQTGEAFRQSRHFGTAGRRLKRPRRPANYIELTGHVTEDVMMAMYLEELSPAERQRLQQHVDHCPVCRQQYNLYREMFAGLDTMAAEAGGAGAALLRQAVQSKIREKLIYYDLMPQTPVGPLLLAMSEKGLCAIHFARFTAFEAEEYLKNRFEEFWLRRDEDAMAMIRHELQEYFSRRLTTFSVPVDWRFMPSNFAREVLELTAKIGYGKIYSYAEIAGKLGKPKSVRAVGGALGRNPVPIVVPCHRVVASGGKLGGFSGGVDIKRKLLHLEGVSWPLGSRQLELFPTL
jgi:O-6-methylguanine DNA methyltransferase